jgi:tRNA A-37 threonylcarbamoyl transferase component Bud32
VDGTYDDHMTVDPAYAEALQRAGLDTVQRVIDCTGDRLYAWSRTTDTIQVFLDDGLSVFIKRYHYPRLKNRLKGMLRGTFFGASRVRSEFRALETMRSLGIQAVRPVAYGERRKLHFVRCCFLITEAVPGSTSLATYAQQHAGENHSPTAFLRRREIVMVLARQVRRMHERRFVHGDLFWRNVLIRILGQQSCEFYFLDVRLGHRIWPGRRDRRAVIDDLAELAAIAPIFCSRIDRIRFIKTYLDLDRLDASSCAWMNRIARRSLAFRGHEALRLRLNEIFVGHLHELQRLREVENP